ncbi:MAG: ATP-binding protein [Verrucomicrobiota bacterium]
MLWFITLLLGLALAFTLLKLRAHRRAVLMLHDSIKARRPMLREEFAEGIDPAWLRLSDASAALIEKFNELDLQRHSQVSQLEATLGSLQEAVLIVDSNNYILLANKALTGIFPRAKNILNQRLELVLHSVDFLNYVEAVRQKGTQPQHEIEFVEGVMSTWVEVTGSTITPLNGGRLPWMLFVLHDITKQKRLEAVRKEFVANVSHELRTPLSVIKGYVETLVDGEGEIAASDQQHFLKTIQRHTERLNSLLEDLLTLSRLESINPGLNRESIDLARTLTQVAEDYRSRPTAAGHRVELELASGLPRVWMDPLKISQVLENLIENALKYTSKGSVIRIVAREQAGEVMVGICDNGPGIPKVDLPHIFERFYRVDKGRSREKGGTGLGLSIVKHIVQLHGGRVWAESEQGRGTSFYFTLPNVRPESGETVRA